MPDIVTIVKTYAPKLATLVRALCHYTTKYQAQIRKAIEGSALQPAQQAILFDFLASIPVACDIFNIVWPAEGS
jgi:hypothetical protein